MNTVAKVAYFGVEIEQSLLGCCLSHEGAFRAVTGTLEPEQFSEGIHASLWRTMRDLTNDGRHVSPLGVLSKLGDIDIELGGLRKIKLSLYIGKLVSETTCPAPYVQDYARQVRENWGLRQLISLSENTREAATLPSADVRGLIAECLRDLDETRARLDPHRSRLMTLGTATTRAAERMARIISGEEKDYAISTGLADLDTKLGGGFRPSDLIITAGRPGMGKTTFAVSQTRQSAAAGNPSVFFSHEMPELQISSRFLADQCFKFDKPINANDIASGNLPFSDGERVMKANEEIKRLPIILDDTASMTVGEIGARVRTVSEEFDRRGMKLGLVTIDYLKFVKATERYRGQRHYEIGEISAGLKQLAKETKTAINLLAQLNREAEKTVSKRPELQHLRESGDLEADADTVLFLFREEYYLANDPNADPVALMNAKGKLEIIVGKQRNGPTGTTEVYIHPGASAVRNAAY